MHNASTRACAAALAATTAVPALLLAPLLLTAAPAHAAEPSTAPFDPEVVALVTDRRVTDASGLATSANGKVLYTHQDAGRATSVFGLGAKGNVQYTIELPAKSNEDWEDMAAVTVGGKRSLYLADTGDAFLVRRTAKKPPRTDFTILRFDEPATNSTGSLQATNLQRYRFRYTSGASVNAETLLVQPGTGRIYVVNKTEKPGARTALWQGPATPSAGAVNAFRAAVASLPVARASGGAFSPNGDRLVIRNDDTAYLWWIKGGDVVRSLAEKPVEIALPTQKQGEGITFSHDGHSLLVNSEGARQPIWRVRLPKGADTERAPRPSPAATTTAESGSSMIPLVIAGVAALLAGTIIALGLRRLR